jgi:hypothetical protein
MAVPMDKLDKLDDLVASHLGGTSSSTRAAGNDPRHGARDRRQERSERQREHIAKLNRRAAESEARLKRLYDAIEAGVADLDDPALKDRIDGLKAIRHRAKADAERAQAMLQNAGSQAGTPQMLSKFAHAARQRSRLEGGGYRRDHLRALAQRVEVAEGEVRIMGSKSRLLRTLVANGGASGVPTQGLKWRRGRDSNPRSPARGTTVFETAPFDRSGTSPSRRTQRVSTAAIGTTREQHRVLTPAGHRTPSGWRFGTGTHRFATRPSSERESGNRMQRMAVELGGYVDHLRSRHNNVADSSNVIKNYDFCPILQEPLVQLLRAVIFDNFSDAKSHYRFGCDALYWLSGSRPLRGQPGVAPFR